MPWGWEKSAAPKSITLLGAVVVVVIAVVVLLFNVIRNATFTPGSKPATTPTRGALATGAPTMTTAPARPPLVVPPDIYGATCGSGVALPEHGWPTRAGRGTPETSCAFAFNVLTAYKNSYPLPGNAARTVYADGIVPCDATGAQCTGEKVVVQCAFYGSDAWITCTDGQNARVYLF
jgi:serine/threonine-protein kinase